MKMRKKLFQERPSRGAFIAAMVISSCVSASTMQRHHINEGRYISLGLIGYNYTNREIESYTVDGAGGGYIRLSSPSSGGSGTACCVRILRNATVPMQVHIRWQAGGCVYLIKDDYTDATDEVVHYFYKERLVPLEDLASGGPEYLETHFYPSGEVKAMLTSAISRPKLQLLKSRLDDSRFPRCKNDVKPE
ncbi:DUF3304 domain-containing protein [Massilia sp. Dwa41.01b]|uniref:DUF3304 domain-containing protein n=1 Tax=unclassified Massilia TaxID=2609279 RepID=UPI0016028F6A|nr:DUF3304 domain-containing protein [Massilia sp. Se16.2.3]QNA90175.1 DUF3304 domain-containing protein [Massilia sp. Dwa41.01b]QNB01067.1 DUF3304 domain-containing protein [Massilia sp. Se16.2.3]